jgi:hypothetical protein
MTGRGRPVRPGRIPQYGLYQGHAVQIIRRFYERPDCRVCGGDGYLGVGGDCGACGGSGKERETVAWAKIGYLRGEKAGTSEVVRAAAVDPA